MHTTPATPTRSATSASSATSCTSRAARSATARSSGSGAIVLNGAVLEDECLVGAGALVPGSLTVPSRAMAIGVPATLKLDAVRPDVHIRLWHGDRTASEVAPTASSSARID